jgi:hypothetical protein
MRHSLLLFLILSLCPVGVVHTTLYGQVVLQQFGDTQTDTWDALSSLSDGEATCFALGYQRQTRVADETFLAPERGVVLGKMDKSAVELWGNLYSRGNTQIHDICPAPEGVYVFGNAFSFLLYQGDTIFPTNGRNTAFILHLGLDGELQQALHFNSRGAVLGQAAIWQEDASQLVTLLQIRDTLQYQGLSWAPRATTASLLLHWTPDLQLQFGTLIDGSGEIEARHLKSIDDEIYVAGRFKGQIDSQTDTLFTRTADFDGFIYAARASGSERFIRHLRGQFEDDVFTLEVSKDALYFGGQFIGNLRLQDIEILTGLQVAGFIGAMDRSGEGLWMYPIRGTSISLAVTAIHPQGDELLFSVWTGASTVFQGDTLWQPTTVGQVHSVLARTDLAGQLLEWNLWPGDNILYITDFIRLGSDLLVAAEMMGQFAGVSSRGFFDVLLIDPDATASYSETAVSTSEIQLYPQPAGGLLCIDGPFPPPYTYEIIALSGQTLRTGRLSTSCLPVSHLPPGSYVLRLIPDGPQRPLSKLWIKGVR